MKTKKILSALLAFILVSTLLCSCGAKSDSPKEAMDMVATESYSGDYRYSDNNYEDHKYGEPAAEEPMAAPDYMYEQEGSKALIADGSKKQNSLSEKIIHTAWVTAETTEFDSSIDTVYDILNKYDAFLESLYISGKSYSETYYGYQSYRYANFTIRVPKENYAALTSSIDEVGIVLETNSTIENITAQYTDVESRLKTYRTEEERLREMLAKAETVEDMITVESRLSEVTYQIESMTSQLKNWDNRVDYCTVHLTVNEVKELSEQVELQRTYWEEMRDGLRSSLKAVGRGFKNFFMWLVTNLPQIGVFLVFAAIFVVVIVIAVKGGNKRKAKKKQKVETKTEENEVNKE